MEGLIEQSVVRKERGSENTAYVVVTAAAVVLFVAAVIMIVLQFAKEMNILLIVLAVVALAAGIVLLLTRGRLHPEYEYSLLQDELSLALIYNSSSRKELGRIVLGNATACGRLNGSTAAEGVHVLHCSLNDGDGQYYLDWQEEGEKHRVVFEPGERLLKAIRAELPEGAWHN